MAIKMAALRFCSLSIVLFTKFDLRSQTIVELNTKLRTVAQFDITVGRAPLFSTFISGFKELELVSAFGATKMAKRQ